MWGFKSAKNGIYKKVSYSNNIWDCCLNYFFLEKENSIYTKLSNLLTFSFNFLKACWICGYFRWKVFSLDINDKIEKMDAIDSLVLINLYVLSFPMTKPTIDTVMLRNSMQLMTFLVADWLPHVTSMVLLMSYLPPNVEI